MPNVNVILRGLLHTLCSQITTGCFYSHSSPFYLLSKWHEDLINVLKSCKPWIGQIFMYPDSTILSTSLPRGSFPAIWVLPWLTLVHVCPHGWSLIATWWWIHLVLLLSWWSPGPFSSPSLFSFSSHPFTLLTVSLGPPDWDWKSCLLLFYPANWLMRTLLLNQRWWKTVFYITWDLRCLTMPASRLHADVWA